MRSAQQEYACAPQVSPIAAVRALIFRQIVVTADHVSMLVQPIIHVAAEYART